jgi:hypothetical protein
MKQTKIEAIQGKTRRNKALFGACIGTGGRRKPRLYQGVAALLSPEAENEGGLCVRAKTRENKVEQAKTWHF